MIECNCLTKDGYKIEYAYTIGEFNYKSLEAYFLKGKKKRKIQYINTPCTFDIETTTYYIDSEDRYSAFMYQWQICIENQVIFGRTWEELQILFEVLTSIYQLDNEHKLVVYVHNLSFEFQFMYNFFNVSNVFATAEHKVLKCDFNDCFEFRCSYYLSNMSLEKFISDTDNTYHLKAKNDLDYKTLRTPATILTPIENGYCYNDVKGLYERITQLLKVDTLYTIPLTSTGFVRRDCRNAMRINKYNHKKFIDTKLTIEQYNLCRDAFRGGNTASNRFNTGLIIKDVHSRDLASAYPFAMLANKYPMGKFTSASIENESQLTYYNNKYCTIGYYRFKGVKIKDDIPIPYIPYSKCKVITSKNMLYNGRVLDAEYLEIALTNIDYEIINKQYDIKEMYIDNFYIARKDYLPYELRQMILKYFTIKSKYKGDDTHYYEYAKSKGKLNAIYGMTVTDILHSEFDFNSDTGDFIEKLNTDLDKYYNNRNNFLCYQWGIFVSAYTRKQLQDGIDIVGNDIIYCDTDSVKYTGDYDEYFTYYNDSVIEYCKKHNITHSAEFNGKQFVLGLFEEDGDYNEFITLGAKKYAYTDTNNELHITVSGLSKKQGAEELKAKGGLEFFRDGEVFYNSGRSVAYYNNEQIHTINIDGCEITTASNIAIVDTTYTLGITDTMKSILLYLGVYNDN